METVRKLRPTESAQDIVSDVESTMEQIPGNYYMVATLLSIAASAYLFVTGRKWAALFVGLWAPTIINYGLFNKLLRPSKEVSGR